MKLYQNKCTHPDFSFHTLWQLQKEFHIGYESIQEKLKNTKHQWSPKLQYLYQNTCKREYSSALWNVLIYELSLFSVQSTEIQVFQIGTIQFFSLPGEIFSEIALKIKEQSPFNNTIAVGVANGYFGYMPTKEEYFEGDYEVNGCKYGPDAGNTFIEATVEVMNTLITKGE